MTRVTDRIVDCFERAGVETVFGFPCEQLDPYYASLADSDLRHVLARSEASAALMADGYARASRSIGIVDGVSGPGAAYIGAGLCEAAGASSPVLALTGGNDRETRGKGVIQDADNEAILDPFTKTTADAETPGRAVEAVEAAMREATGGVPGPAHVNLPEDVVRAETDHEPRDDLDATFPAARPRPSPAEIDAVLENLSDADRPVILAGEGIVRANAADELSAFAKRTNTPVVTSMNGKGAVAETAPYALGVVGRWGFCQVANDAVADADLVIGLGTRFGDLTTVGWSLVPEDAAVVHVDRDPAWLGRNYEADVPIGADLRATIDALNERIEAGEESGLADEAAFADRADLIDELAAARDAWRESHADEFESDASPITPQRVIAELNRTLPADGVLVSATSFPGFFSGAFYEPAEPGLRYLQARGSDGINACLPQAIGVQLARPDVPVVALSGDGGIGYHIADLETAAREDLPLTVIVTNNESLGSSKMSQMGSYNVDQSTDFEPGIDYAQVARGFGCAGEVIEDPAALPDAVAAAIESDEPTLLDVYVDPYAAPPLLV
ncbi:thiamine pyrophosphate-binding protein [Halovivax cerinus]|uniref:Thiamine pyrophosphate-binding protein n=1 Tax=Halovivax cerinus TaxID=1487865 RepID=A0ABD5NJR5_9EURY|nr:thiamine pyrophosphate-binding protein [Halovivax cerinus]